MVEQSPTPDETDTLLDITRWQKERARPTEDAPPEYDENAVTHILEDCSDAEFDQWLPGPPGRDGRLARIQVNDVTENGETVDYSIELSEELVKAAVEAHPEL